MDELTINTAYSILAEKKLLLSQTAERVIEFTYVLDTKKVQALQDGTIEGKNAEIRDAVSREFLKSEYADLKLAEYDANVARTDYDLAQIEVSRVQALLRLAEVLK